MSKQFCFLLLSNEPKSYQNKKYMSRRNGVPIFFLFDDGPIHTTHAHTKRSEEYEKAKEELMGYLEKNEPQSGENGTQIECANGETETGKTTYGAEIAKLQKLEKKYAAVKSEIVFEILDIVQTPFSKNYPIIFQASPLSAILSNMPEIENSANDETRVTDILFYLACSSRPVPIGKLIDTLKLCV